MIRRLLLRFGLVPVCTWTRRHRSLLLYREPNRWCCGVSWWRP